MNRLKIWMLKATPEQQQALADAATNGSRAYLYHLSQDRRTPSADHGRAIEAYTTRLNKETKGEMPIVYRTDIVPACKKCTFARDCLGASIVNRP